MRVTVATGVCCTLLMAAAPGSDARMYQWVSPSSSVPQLSGEPPPWYRSGRDGPRVQVFDNGNLVDDTAIALPASQREALRAAAFREADERRRADALKRLERAAQREAQARAFEEQRLAEARRREEQQAATPAPAATEAPATEVRAAARARRPSAVDAPITEDTVAQLKAIIAEFDRRGGGRRKPR